MDGAGAPAARDSSASPIVIGPSGGRVRVPISELPFLIGRQASSARRVREVVRGSAPHDSRAMYDALAAALVAHTSGAVQKDDITVMVVEYRSERD
jgi:hypothetical protein